MEQEVQEGGDGGGGGGGTGGDGATAGKGHQLERLCARRVHGCERAAQFSRQLGGGLLRAVRELLQRHLVLAGLLVEMAPSPRLGRPSVLRQYGSGAQERCQREAGSGVATSRRAVAVSDAAARAAAGRTTTSRGTWR